MKFAKKTQQERHLRMRKIQNRPPCLCHAMLAQVHLYAVFTHRETISSHLRTFAALSRAALLRDGHTDLNLTMTVLIGLVTAGNNHFVGNLLLELRPRSLEKIPKVIIF